MIPRDSGICPVNHRGVLLEKAPGLESTLSLRVYVLPTLINRNQQIAFLCLCLLGLSSLRGAWHHLSLLDEDSQVQRYEAVAQLVSVQKETVPGAGIWSWSSSLFAVRPPAEGGLTLLLGTRAAVLRSKGSPNASLL